MIVDSPHSVRSFLVDSLHRDLMGPINLDDNGNPDFEETLRLEGGIPQNFYITGYLEPRHWNDQEECVDGFRTKRISPTDQKGLSSPWFRTQYGSKTNEITTGKTMQGSEFNGRISGHWR